MSIVLYKQHIFAEVISVECNTYTLRLLTEEDAGRTHTAPASDVTDLHRLYKRQVEVRPSATHGQGVFALRDIDANQLLFCDFGDALLCAHAVLRIQGEPKIGISTAWPLAIHLLRRGRRTWPFALHRNKRMRKDVLKDDANKEMHAHLCKTYAPEDIENVLELVLTNHFVSEGSTTVPSISTLGLVSSRINSSFTEKDENVYSQLLFVELQNGDLMPLLAWFSKKRISAGEELVYLYGETSMKYLQ